MSIQITICPNCGSTFSGSNTECDRCGEIWANPGNGIPRFSEAAREAPLEFGGLLSLHEVHGVFVSHVGICPSGAIGVSAEGRLVWTLDVVWVSSFEVSEGGLEIDGRRIDVDLGVAVE